MYFASTHVSWYSAHLLLKSNISLIRYLLVNLSAAEISFNLTSLPLTPTAWALEMKPLLPVQLRQLGWRPSDTAADKPRSACHLLWGGCQPLLLTRGLTLPGDPPSHCKPGCWHHPPAPCRAETCAPPSSHQDHSLVRPGGVEKNKGNLWLLWS